MDLKQTVRTIPNWPIDGVMFRDITTLLQDADAFAAACDIFYERYKHQNIDKIVGIDARGFVFSSVLAYRLHVGFIPVRKKGKLPADTIRRSYSLEYGKNELEIHSDAIRPGERVLIVDDLIATGGTIAATIELVEALGGEVVECGFLIELPDLKGREAIAGHPFFAQMQFEGD